MKCLVDYCDKPQRSRGLCSGHIANVASYVKLGKFTWIELEHAGKVLPLQKRGKGPGRLMKWLKS